MDINLFSVLDVDCLEFIISSVIVISEIKMNIY